MAGFEDGVPFSARGEAGTRVMDRRANFVPLKVPQLDYELFLALCPMLALVVIQIHLLTIHSRLAQLPTNPQEGREKRSVPVLRT
eukprot:scaffold22630_cov29-Tisochrysis_lutea.AAC.5